MLLRAWSFLVFVVVLVREVCLATWAVVKVVLGPIDRIRSGFVAMPLECDSDLEVTVLANSITLTPGTITVHVDPSHDFLVMHAIDVGDDPEDLRETTRRVLESHILAWTRGPRPAPVPAAPTRAAGSPPASAAKPVEEDAS